MRFAIERGSMEARIDKVASTAGIGKAFGCRRGNQPHDRGHAKVCEQMG
jgi:hypothetical protein